MKQLPVVAAIANYNMASELSTLLPVLTKQGYDDIYVLDDASTDESREVVAHYGSSVQFVPGVENKGAGGNRNRIFNELGQHAIIHFLDADITLLGDRMAERVREVVPREPFGFIGGMAQAPTGLQSIWNYGPRQSLWADTGAALQVHIEPLLAMDPDKAVRLRSRFASLLADWPDPLQRPERRQIFWAVEQNLVMRSDVFASLGGFDPSLREHEIQDLAIRMAHRGLKRYFDPLVAVRHTEGQVREYNRQKAMLGAECKIARKHGFLNWLLPDGHLRPEL